MKSNRFLCMATTVFMLSFMLYGCGEKVSQTVESAKPAVAAAEQKDANVLKGPIVGRSNKAKTISITVGKGDAAKTMMLRFDDNTEGVDFAKKGEAAIITWEQRGDDKFATVVKPNLAKLPEGISEISVDEVFKLLQDQAPMTLVDARPELRYNQGHLPGAINIPVPLLKEKKAEVLPEDKNKLLVFYCGGYT